MNRIEKDIIYYLDLFVIGRNGSPANGLTIAYKVERSSDNSLIESGSLIEIGNGIYQKTVEFNNIGQYRIIYTTPSGYSDVIEHVLVIEKQYELLLRILGLSQENYRIINPIYDNKNNLIRGTIKIYSSSEDCNNNVNAISQYQIDATYDNKNRMKTYKVIKE